MPPSSIYMFAGRPEQALDQLEVALTEQSSVITAGRLRIDPTFAPLRGNPRLERLLGVKP